jgi:translation initiation factor 5B
MAPKGKKGKKAGDDWDEGLGESADPIAQADAEAKAADAAEEEETGGGGLMAALRKNKEKRKKKGKNVGPDDLEGEGDTVTPTVDESLDLAAKAPVEATMDDDDLFGGPAKKGKGGKGGKQQPAKQADADAEEETGGVKTKAQKEKEKKEREKQRKKEQVCLTKSSKFMLE